MPRITTKHVLAAIFFLSGVGVMTARMGQQGGMYLFLFLVPLCLARWEKINRRLIFQVGFSGWCLYATFDLIDLIHWSYSGFSYRIPANVLTKSKFSSILGASGVLFMLIGRSIGRESAGSIVTRNFLVAWFFDGLFIGSALLLFYGVLQFITGFDFSSVAAYRPDRIIGGGFHRIAGFSSHPLSLAGLSLALMAFCGALSFKTAIFSDWDSELTVGKRLGVPVKQRLLATAVIHAILVTLSGSRMATILVLMEVVLFGLILLRRHWRHGWVKLSAMGCLLLTGAVLYKAGFIERLMALKDAQRGGDQRFNFWQIHWAMFKESPWIGHGRYYLETIARDQFYDRMFPAADVQRYNAHNIFLEVLAMGGLIGCSLIVGCTVWWMRQVHRLSELGGGLGQAFWGPWCLALLANLLHGLTQNTFFDSAVLAPYLYVVWLLVSLQLYTDSPTSNSLQDS